MRRLRSRTPTACIRGCGAPVLSGDPPVPLGLAFRPGSAVDGRHGPIRPEAPRKSLLFNPRPIPNGVVPRALLGNRQVGGHGLQNDPPMHGAPRQDHSHEGQVRARDVAHPAEHSSTMLVLQGRAGRPRDEVGDRRASPAEKPSQSSEARRLRFMRRGWLRSSTACRRWRRAVDVRQCSRPHSKLVPTVLCRRVHRALRSTARSSRAARCHAQVPSAWWTRSSNIVSVDAVMSSATPRTRREERRANVRP